MSTTVIRQHLIDPELCIRCNTCEESCTKGAITHDANNYVVEMEKCNACMECVANCPTGSVDNWRLVPSDQLYTIEDQFSWSALPEQGPLPEGANMPDGEASQPTHGAPASAATPSVGLYTAQAPVTATLAVNQRVTAADAGSDIRHIVLDFGSANYPVLEGQSVGVLPPGNDASGAPYQMRVYSIASARDGEEPGRNLVALTVKRVLEDHEGKPARGVCSNYLCDLAPGEQVKVVGPFGANYLMPNHPEASIMMICTGTGIAPMRAMIERRRRTGQTAPDAKMVLFYGGRTPAELPYHDDLQALPAGLLDLNLAFSRVAGQPKQYVQDAIRVKGSEVAKMLTNPETYIYVCGLKGMEAGIVAAFEDICRENGMDWASVQESMKSQSRLHIETY